MKRLVGTLAALALAGCGMLKVNVNGQTMSLGGSSPSASSSSASAPASNASGEKAPAVNDKRVVETVALDPSITDAPKVVTVAGVGLGESFRKVTGFESPDCGSNTSGKPLVAFELKQAMPADFVVAVSGGRDDGFALKRADSLWVTCTQRTNETPVMGAPKDGWAPGKYEVYPVARYGGDGGKTFQVEFYNPKNPLKWSDVVQKLSISKKLDKPLFVQVTVKKDRVKLREEHNGDNCELPMPREPDLALTLERPIPGLTVRPLYTREPVALRVQEPDSSRGKGRKYCPSYRRDVVASGYAPSWESPAEFHFNNEAEGTFGLSLATPKAEDAQQVTLMIFDASTKFDALALVPPQGEVALPDRVLERYYPQLDTRVLGVRNHQELETTAKLFSSAPKELFVYSRLDLDKDLVRTLSGYVADTSFPKKNEPLLLLDANADYVQVLTADGIRYQLKATHVLPKPDGSPALAAAPRPLRKDLNYGDLLNLAPASAKTISAAYEAKMKKYDACADKVWKPYGKQLDGATWTVRDSGGGSTTIESPRAQKIRDTGNAAIAKACGSDAQLEKDKETTRARLLVEVEKERAKLLTTARPRL